YRVFSTLDVEDPEEVEIDAMSPATIKVEEGRDHAVDLDLAVLRWRSGLRCYVQRAGRRPTIPERSDRRRISHGTVVGRRRRGGGGGSSGPGGAWSARGGRRWRRRVELSARRRRLRVGGSRWRGSWGGCPGSRDRWAMLRDLHRLLGLRNLRCCPGVRLPF